MALKTLTENDLRTNGFLDEFSEYITFDSDTKTLKLKNLRLNSLDKNGQLLSQVRNAISPDIKGEILILENVEFEANNLNLNIANKIIIKSCSVKGDYSFYQAPKEIEIIDCDIPHFSFRIDTRVILIENSTVGKINIIAMEDSGPRIKVISIQGKSTILCIDGLHELLRSELGTVIIFSQESKIIKDAEQAYRIMRLLSNKFGDVVQSHIFHTKLIELYEPHADGDTKSLLFLEKLTNNYGRSIFLPILWMLIINLLILFIFLLASDDFNSINCWDFIGSALNVSPLSSFISDEISRTSWEFSLDSIRRIVLAALTYQIIVSARRFSFIKK